jgi:excisionase family DNA binding protein
MKMRRVDPDELLTVTQAAKVRNVTRQAIDFLIRKGQIEVIEIAGKRFIRRSALSTYKPKPGGRPPKDLPKM